MTIDLMVDLETAGTGPDAAILSIGAVAFDPAGETRSYVDSSETQRLSFYRTVDLDSCL